MTNHKLYSIEITSAVEGRYIFECLRLPTKGELIAELRYQAGCSHDEAEQAANDYFDGHATVLYDQSSNLETMAEVVTHCPELPTAVGKVAITVAGVNIGSVRITERIVRG